MVGGLPQMGAGLGDLAGDDIGYGHPRIGRSGLAADQGDGRVRIDAAQRFGGHHTGRAGTDDDMMHRQPPQVRARRFSVSGVGTPSAVQPRIW